MRVSRVVIDTNVLISAALSATGKPAAVVAWAMRNSALIASKEILDELRTRLARPKFDRYADAEDREDFVRILERAAILVQTETNIALCRDPDDDKLLEAAMAGYVDCIVSGDQDLLVLDPFCDIRVLTPAAFLEILEGNQDE